MDVITTKNLDVRYGQQLVLKGVNVTIPARSFFVILGENGAGKTTLIKALLGQNKQVSGQLKVTAKKIGYVPQFREISRDYPLSIRAFVGLSFNQGARLWNSPAENQMIDKVLTELDLSEIADQRLGLASGGQKQRAYVAQALVQQPDLLILDESTASLDSRHSLAVVETIKAIQVQQGMTILWITHDTSGVQDYADHYLAIADHQVSEGLIEDLPDGLTSLAAEREERHV